MNKLYTFFVVLYQLIKLKFKYKNHIFLIALSGIGDLCYSLSVIDFIKAQKKKELLLISNNYTCQFKNYYPIIDDVLLLSEQKENLFKMFFYVKKDTYTFNRFSLFMGIFFCYPLTETVYNKIKEHKESYIEIFKKTLGIKQLSLYYPHVDSETEKDSLMNYSNTVIINPYSNSLKINNDIFSLISKHLKNKGYDVYTNLTGDQKTLPGSKALHCNLQELYTISSKAKLFISVRSGIVDFCINNKGNFLIIYDDCWDGAFKNAYTMSSWKTNSTIYEADYTDKDKILEYVDFICK